MPEAIIVFFIVLAIGMIGLWLYAHPQHLESIREALHRRRLAAEKERQEREARAEAERKEREAARARQLQEEQERKAREEEERRAREEAERLRKQQQLEAAEKIKQSYLSANPYIAPTDWEAMKKRALEVCPFYELDDSEIQKRNKAFREQQLEEHKEYFDTLLTYPLDEQQREAIVTLAENVLVVAAAGSGKTSTIVAKTHYLVNKMKVDPRNILVVTYTRKAAEELQTRVGVSGVECCTFHRHAMDTIARIEGASPAICDSNILGTLFDTMVHSNPDYEASMFLYQTFQKTLLQYDYKYDSYKAYLKALAEYGKLAPYRDMDDKLVYVKSRQEMEIMAILTELGLNVRYEEKYPIDTSSSKYRQYKPDFTIYYTKDGENKVLYLEHFAVDRYGRVPLWFGDGKQGGWSKADREYNEGMHWKQQLHADYGTTMIYTTSADFEDGPASARERIIEMLDSLHVPYQPLTMEQKTKKLAVPLHRSMESLIKLVSGFIALIKANGRTVNDIIKAIPTFDTNRERNTYLLKQLVEPLYQRYSDTLKESKEMDFTDCLLRASELLQKQQIYNYDYILVDEFQDMSMDKYKYLSALRRTNPRTRIFCVGDDWQSIYRFSGSDISLFSQFEKYNGPTEELKIEATHRFGQPLLDRSSEFILHNLAQKKKVLRPDKDRVTHLAFAGYKDAEEQRAIIENQVARLPQGKSVYIISRYRFDIGAVFPEVANVVSGERGGSIELEISGRRVKALTAHSSKGLEADYVFLINCNSGYDDFGFPSQVADDPILEYVLSRSDAYEHAEERRVFYVAITRAKRATYVLYDRQYPSLFVTEMGGVGQGAVESKNTCPRCRAGSLKFTKDGYAKNGHFYTVVRCTNKACDMQNETIFFNPERFPFQVMDFDHFLTVYHVTPQERAHIQVTTSPDFVADVLHIPCVAESPQGLDVAIDPRYENVNLKWFYEKHLREGDLTVTIQTTDGYERFLLGYRK